MRPDPLKSMLANSKRLLVNSLWTLLHWVGAQQGQPDRSPDRDSRRAPPRPLPQLRAALYRVAGDTRLVKDVLGHSDTRMTERYTLSHVPEAMRLLATSRFEVHLQGSARRNP